ncbi:MAG: ABC transporter ATP-binding protein [Brevinema sp.]
MFLETKNINKIYHNSSVPFQALVDINIQVPQGSIGALIGSSGSGKTTLLNIIGALDTATSGEILIDDESITQKNSKELSLFRRNYLGFIFQSYNLIPVLTAYENVALSLFDTPEREKKDKVMNILSVVGLSSKENNYPNQLSGGQQQRVSIARALVKTPKLLLADEPTANLDSKTGYQILELISEINQKEKITVLFSTHDHRIMDIAQHSFLLKDGMIVKEK